MIDFPCSRSIVRLSDSPGHSIRAQPPVAEAAAAAGSRLAGRSRVGWRSFAHNKLAPDRRCQSSRVAEHVLGILARSCPAARTNSDRRRPSPLASAGTLAIDLWASAAHRCDSAAAGPPSAMAKSWS